MAKNKIYEPGWKLSVPVTDPASPVSGDPVRYGVLTGVALTDKGDGGNVAANTTVDFGPGVYDIPVVAEASAIAEGDALFYDDAIHGVNNDSVNGIFFGFAMEAIGNGLTDTINALHIPSPGAGSLANLSVTTAKLAANAVTEAKMAAASLTGLVAAVVANANVIGGIPVLHRILVPAGANADVDLVLTHKTRITDFWFALKGAGTAGSTVTLKNGANAISDAIDASAGGDKDVFRAGELDDAQHEVAAGGTLRVTKASTGGDFPGVEAYALGIRVA